MSKHARALMMLMSLLYCSAAAGEEFKLRYHTNEGMEFSFWYFTGTSLTLRRPAELKRVPPLHSRQPIYSSLRLGNNDHAMILDKPPEEETHYTLIYFDQNANRDLTDDPVLRGRIQGFGQEYDETEFPAIDTTVTVGGARLP